MGGGGVGGGEGAVRGRGGRGLEGILLGSSNFESPAEGENQMYLLVGMRCHCRMPATGQLNSGFLLFTIQEAGNFKVKNLVVGDLPPGESLRLCLSMC